MASLSTSLFSVEPMGYEPQGYLMKMPLDLVEILPKLPDLLDDVPVAFPSPPAPPDNSEPGEDYIPVDVAVPQVERDPFSVDPAAVERGLRSHRELQNLLAEGGQDRL